MMPGPRMRTALSIIVSGSLIAIAFLLNTDVTEAGGKIYVGNASPSKQVPIDRIDHSSWDRLLHKYVDADGMVNYRGLKSSASDLRTLNDYLASLSTASTSRPASREAKLAFWINAYNAVTIHGILREYPTSSIRNHTAKLVGYNIWHDLQLYVGGRPYSLDHIEHKILRPMGDPRIHFAIVCASIGCPRLLNEAWVTSRVATQLDTNAKDFFSRPQNFRFDESKKRFYMSSILSWFGKDFGNSRAEQLRTISQWLPTDAAQKSAQQNAVAVSFLDYDWKLNEQSR